MAEVAIVGSRADEVLAVKDLAVEFHTDSGWVRVVDDVNFNVGNSETLGIVGESGSGKTVMSLAVMGLLPPKRSRVTGSIKLLGRELVGIPERELADVRGRDMAMVFQEPRRSLDPAFTVGTQIAEAVRRHENISRKAAKARAAEMLDKVGIADPQRRADAYPHQFSGGMCQRVMLAIALACRPRLLIADEPTTALDVTVQKEMLRLMNQLQAEFEVGILFITHDLGVVGEMCDRVNVMYAGQVVEGSAIDDLFDQPMHPYTAGLLAAVPESVPRGGRLPYIPGAVPAPKDWPTSCRFFDRCTYALTGRCDVGPIQLESVGAGRLARCARPEIRLEGIANEATA